LARARAVLEVADVQFGPMLGCMCLLARSSTVEVAAASPAVRLGPELALQLHQTPHLGAVGAYTLQDHAAIFNSVDHNDNGVVCFKDVAALNGGAADASGWQYLYNLVDDNASVPDR
jgi:hypothetical protein